MTFEESLERKIFSNSTGDKTFIDKLLAQKDVDAIRVIIKKSNLSREDMIELLYLLSSNESKMLNYGEWDRYIILKFFVWIREFVKLAELMFDYEDDLLEKEKKGVFVLSDRTKKLLKNNKRLIEHNVKFLIDLYVNIARTTLSLGASGFMEILKNKYEISYPEMKGVNTSTQDSKGGLFSFRR